MTGDGGTLMNRRQFLAGGLASATGAALEECEGAAPIAGAAWRTASPQASLIASAPVLMNPAERTMDVAFAVNGDASGWVEVSKSPDMAKAVRVHSGGDNPLMTIRDGFASVRIKGLRPAAKYYYRVGADGIRFEKDYKIYPGGTETQNKVYSFTTLGAEAEGSFCVINDTHSVAPVVECVMGKLAAIKPSAIVWNGDVCHSFRVPADATGAFLAPHPDHLEYAAETPVLFLNGNHDFRGRFARRLHELVQFRDVCERSPQFAGLGRNFVQRIGDIALIGLDTGEDKQDTNPVMCGASRMTRYRELQTRWLAEEIGKDAVKTAKFKVAFCHIPLFDPRRDENPGDVLPADADPRYKHPWAAWQRTCANLWGPLFEKAGVQLVITGQQHIFRYDPPAPGRTWAQIVGGGPEVVSGRARSFPTAIEGRIVGNELCVTVHDCWNNRVVFNRKFKS